MTEPSIPTTEEQRARLMRLLRILFFLSFSLLSAHLLYCVMILLHTFAPSLELGIISPNDMLRSIDQLDTQLFWPSSVFFFWYLIYANQSPHIKTNRHPEYYTLIILLILGFCTRYFGEHIRSDGIDITPTFDPSTKLALYITGNVALIASAFLQIKYLLRARRIVQFYLENIQ